MKLHFEHKNDMETRAKLYKWDLASFNEADKVIYIKRTSLESKDHKGKQTAVSKLFVKLPQPNDIVKTYDPIRFGKVVKTSVKWLENDTLLIETVYLKEIEPQERFDFALSWKYKYMK